MLGWLIFQLLVVVIVFSSAVFVHNYGFNNRLLLITEQIDYHCLCSCNSFCKVFNLN